MSPRNQYKKYVFALESLVGFFSVNLAYVLASELDTDITGFRFKVTLLLVNICYLPVLASCYRYPMPRAVHADRVVIRAIWSVLIEAVCFFTLLAFLDSWVPNVSFYLWFFGTLFCLLPFGWVVARLVVKRVRAHGRNAATVVIVGTGPTAMRLYSEMLSDPGYGYRCMGFFSIDPQISGVAEMTYLGTVNDLSDFLGRNDVSELYYTVPGEDADMMVYVAGIADDHMVRFNYVPQLGPYVTRVPEMTNIGGVAVLTLNYNPLAGVINRCIKRGFDVFFSVAAIVVLAPLLFLPVAVVIKLTSPGPVFFRQKRTGYLGKEFMCYKFRTMYVNGESDVCQAKKDDPRVTSIGRWLRHTSIDEMPQFFNVFMGDMSVVGPRPHMLSQTNDYRNIVRKYMVRHFIKPGITGWAQIRGFRGQTRELWQMEKRVECDIWYIENWNLFLDIKIIFLTVLDMIRGDENAF